MMQKGPVKEKRRFIPKAQVKAEPVAEVAPAPSVPPEPTHGKGKGGSGREGGGKGGKGGKGGGGRGGKGGGKGGGRGGRFVIPAGQAFFTGGSASAPPPSSGSGYSIGISNAPSVGRSGTVGVKEEKSDGHVKVEEAQKDETEGAETHLRPPPSDEEDDEGGKVNMEWPPVDFNELDPVALPFGPRTLEKRVELANQAIFADTNDAAAIEKEENESMFLLQLPSSLAQGSFVPPDDVHVAGGISAVKPRKQLKPGKLGKIQITQSGKVFLLVTEDAEDEEGGEAVAPRLRRYEINRGITPSFMQVVASITTKAGARKGDSQEEQSMQKAAGARAGELKDELHLLGTVTDKIVVTPDFDIGQRGSTFTSSSLRQGTNQGQGIGNSSSSSRGGSSSGVMNTFQEEVVKAMHIKDETVL